MRSIIIFALTNTAFLLSACGQNSETKIPGTYECSTTDESFADFLAADPSSEYRISLQPSGVAEWLISASMPTPQGNFSMNVTAAGSWSVSGERVSLDAQTSDASIRVGAKSLEAQGDDGRTMIEEAERNAKTALDASVLLSAFGDAGFSTAKLQCVRR